MTRNWIIPAGIAAALLLWFRRARAALPGMEESLPLDMTALLAQVDEENEQYVVLASELAAEAGIPQEGFMQQIWVESRFNPTAGSPAGAIGIAQFLPATAAEYGIDPLNPEQSLRAAIEYMQHWHNVYQQNGFDYPWSLALAAYNAGPGRTMRWLSDEATLPRETNDYIQLIARYYGENPPAWV